MIEVAARRLKLPLGNGEFMWVREDEIAHVLPYNDRGKCDVVFRTAHYVTERADGTVIPQSSVTVQDTADNVIDACLRAQR